MRWIAETEDGGFGTDVPTPSRWTDDFIEEIVTTSALLSPLTPLGSQSSTLPSRFEEFSRPLFPRWGHWYRGSEDETAVYPWRNRDDQRWFNWPVRVPTVVKAPLNVFFVLCWNRQKVLVWGLPVFYLGEEGLSSKSILPRETWRVSFESKRKEILVPLHYKVFSRYRWLCTR